MVDRRFWQSERLGSKAATDGLVGATWEATAGQPGVGAVLTAFSGGPAATVCRRRWSQGRGKAYREDLEALYPHYAEHCMAACFVDWPGDPWTQAGCSFPAPGQVTTVGPLLHSGLRRLYFAGNMRAISLWATWKGHWVRASRWPDGSWRVRARLLQRRRLPRPFEMEAGNPISSQARCAVFLP